jgi:hypothetical protein
LTSKRLALLFDRVLSRLGTALLILLLVVLILALTLGAFPRTLLGVLVLIVVGGPIYLIAEALGEFGSSWGPRTRHAPVQGLIGLIVLLALVWWWCARHAAFLRHNFL